SLSRALADLATLQERRADEPKDDEENGGGTAKSRG
ncbi:MAG: hypothetical protein QOK13_1825, partial [Gaiellaceae bacterium]|nr:hypothetical protein [Gaiellaceae bacterium]